MVNQIAIVIPAYNEEKNIERLVKSIKHYVGKVLIIVVDDSNNNKISTIIKKKLDILYFNRGKKAGRGSAILVTNFVFYFSHFLFSIILTFGIGIINFPPFSKYLILFFIISFEKSHARSKA